MKHLFLSLLCLFALNSCGSSSDETTLTVAVSADNPPYEFIQDGKIVGLDVEIIEALGAALGKKVIIKNLDFPGLFPALSSKNIDCVISAISVTEARKEHFDFTDVYASSPMSMIVRDADGFKTIDDLNGKTIGVQLGTTWEIEAKKIAETHPGTIIRSLSNNLVLIEELKSGSVDAVLLEKMQVAEFIKNNSGLSFFDPAGLSSDFAIVLNKGSDLLPKLNKAIGELQKNGKLETIINRWLKTE